jgi:hypothetical protein
VLIYEQMAAPNAYIPAKLLSTDSLTVRLVLIRPVLWMRPRGLAVHGDVDIVPAGTPSRWEIMHDDTALVIGVQSAILSSVAEEHGVVPSRAEVLNRFQTRDPQIEHIGGLSKPPLYR